MTWQMTRKVTYVGGKSYRHLRTMPDVREGPDNEPVHGRHRIGRANFPAWEWCYCGARDLERGRLCNLCATPPLTPQLPS